MPQYDYEIKKNTQTQKSNQEKTQSHHRKNAEIRMAKKRQYIKIKIKPQDKRTQAAIEFFLQSPISPSGKICYLILDPKDRTLQFRRAEEALNKDIVIKTINNHTVTSGGALPPTPWWQSLAEYFLKQLYDSDELHKTALEIRNTILNLTFKSPDSTSCEYVSKKEKLLVINCMLALHKQNKDLDTDRYRKIQAYLEETREILLREFGNEH